MPAFVTHAAFAQQSLADSGFALRDCCLRHANLYRFGAQGPDVFYFFNYSSPGHGYGALADAMHEQLGSTAPLEALHEINERERSRAMMCAYLCGFASHLALDELAHPIVEARAKDIAAAGNISEDCAHAMLESRFESRHYNERTGKQANDYLYEADLPQNAAEREAIARAWSLLLPSVQHEADVAALTLEQQRLPRLLNILFTAHGGPIGRVCTFLRCVSGRDFTLRWFFKRPYGGDNEPMSEGDYAALGAAYDEAMKKYLHLVSY